MNERWIADLEKMELSERQPDNSYRVAYKMRPMDGKEATPEWADRYTLPCDVRLPPRTTIRKGCSLSTLITGLIAREKIEGEKPREFGDYAEKLQTALDRIRLTEGCPRSIERIALAALGVNQQQTDPTK